MVGWDNLCKSSLSYVKIIGCKSRPRPVVTGRVLHAFLSVVSDICFSFMSLGSQFLMFSEHILRVHTCLCTSAYIYDLYHECSGAGLLLFQSLVQISINRTPFSLFSRVCNGLKGAHSLLNPRNLQRKLDFIIRNLVNHRLLPYTPRNLLSCLVASHHQTSGWPQHLSPSLLMRKPTATLHTPKLRTTSQ